ncbi:MAG TPA: SPFH domain-containing protein [Candidatus Paceibacterota bacterium]|nr:SPFH domain-containing protein [Candidatus Paceibacterota bacterium]
MGNPKEVVMFIVQVFLGFFLMLILAAITSPLWLFWLANSPRLAHISPFTTIRDGEAKVVMRGDSFRRVIGRKEGCDIVTPENKEHYPGTKVWSVVQRNPDAPKREPFFQKHLGLYWVGIPPFQKLYHYTFGWVTYKAPEGETDPRPVKRNEELFHIFIKDALYWGTLKEAETFDKMPVDVGFLITLRVTNVYDALFQVHRYLDAILDLVRQQGRQYVGTKTYEELVQEEGDEDDEGFSGGVYMLRERVSEEYGVQIVRAGILSIDPAGSAAAQYREASTAAYLAEAKKIATVTAAEGEARSIELVGNAREQALNAQIRAYDQSPQAAQATLNAEAARAMGIEHVARAVTAGIRAGFTSETQNPEPAAD